MGSSKQPKKKKKPLSVQEMAEPNGKVHVIDSDEDMENWLKAIELRKELFKKMFGP